MTRRNTRRHEPETESYRMAGKPHDPTLCPTCGAAFLHGHWQWTEGRIDAAEHMVCPACRRTADALPAAMVTIDGPFAHAHRDEILALVRHESEHEMERHPLNRLMEVVEDGEIMRLTTTEPHLANRLATALHAAYAGTLERHWARGDTLARFSWMR